MSSNFKIAAATAFASGALAAIFIQRLVKRSDDEATMTASPVLPYPQNLQRLHSLNSPESITTIDSNCGVYYNEGDAPKWAKPLFQNESLRRVYLKEWEDVSYRQQGGWNGTDLIHNPTGRGVQVFCYFFESATKTLTGVVRFGEATESHRGLCHGGAMTSLMDDLLGHIAFIEAGDAPWSGATVQVNVKILKPVKVGSVLKITGRVTKRERKKVFIKATLSGGDANDDIYATMDGLTIQPVNMQTTDDEIARRIWISKETTPIVDSGWFKNSVSRL